MSPPAQTTGRLITLEGGEGAGKSTQIALLADTLRGEGYNVRTTREPGGTRLGEAVRGVLMGAYETPMPPMSELLLVFAARAAHLAEVIEPAIAAGEIVLCDRFTDASYAYQGAARGLDGRTIARLEAEVQGRRRPDGVLVLDLPVADGMARAAARGKRNRFDDESLVFHEAVRRCYLERARAAPERYAVIDAGAPVEIVAKRIAAAVKVWL